VGVTLNIGDFAMTRWDLATQLSYKLGITKEEEDNCLAAFMSAIKKGLDEDGKVVMRGFGSFRMKEYESRMGKRPNSSEHIYIPKRTKAVFSPGKELREIVNQVEEESPMASADYSPPNVFAAGV
jgi:nucleoid DNA-binding protein|tara:strand:- start:207 stop:581 length:375 start_codon:yes stop_codon:yes gene_type:complete